MAAAYLFHICRNHPFIDGNKRASLGAALTFLWLNRMHVKASEDEITEPGDGTCRQQDRQARGGRLLEAPRPPTTLTQPA